MSNCPVCGKESKGKYCSKACMYNRSKVTQSCRKCGKVYTVSPSRTGSGFCSTKCWYEWEGRPTAKIKKICPTCRKIFETWPKDDCTYCSYKCIKKEPRYGEENSNWKGGRTIHSDGYVYLKGKEHPFAGPHGYVFEHRLVMEQYLRENHPDHPALIRLGEKLYLSPDYEVHHKDGVRTNNRIENLEVLTKSEHTVLHNDKRLSDGSHNFKQKGDSSCRETM